ncbi:putative actin associated protein wsp1 protein [Dipodascopsis tothii]|uniref:putative actin associated protein wsp1 protein n=1 Tax=Dipodascopsis tothii TaxID=44089 RepID=UPI0034CE124A
MPRSAGRMHASTLTSADKDRIKRVIPKTTNKIHAAAVARLYVAHPDATRWQYTGLSGAVVLANDLTGNTFFLKLVDINGNRGVIWDQELYVDFAYNQDRVFFHSFELDECLAGLSFVDDGEAHYFFKRVSHRDKHASKATLLNKDNAVSLRKRPLGPSCVQSQAPGTLSAPPTASKAAGPRGDLSRFQKYGVAGCEGVVSRSAASSAGPSPWSTPTGSMNSAPLSLRRKAVPPTPTPAPKTLSGQPDGAEVDPTWRHLFEKLEGMGISQDMIHKNADFIMDYVEGARPPSRSPPPAPTGPSSTRSRRSLPPPLPPRRG